MKDTKVRRMFEDIAFSYDFQNSALSLGIDIYWRKRFVDRIRPGYGLVLDAATGTGEVGLAIRRRRPGLKVLGVDFSPAMLAVAREKIRKRKVAGYDLAVADCRDLPVAANTVSAVTMAFGIRNIAERVAVMREFHRALVPGGEMHVMEFGLPRNGLGAALYRFYFDRILPPVGNFLSRTDYAYSYLVESVDAFPKDADFLAQMAEAGFAGCTVTDLTFGLARIFTGRKP
ncbi:ubiquinone/menaquinone biosynthesis methyltransferase [Solidesulfovibrio carbinoliphilus subsp. oakridgensis]|uniref:Demethylmenaquinone methyltransferase n=1 Tax=Solidesulfovibrio carbinoliphilus subsp. oakridgensis TaxID=694327 RepID=G7Q8U4_9BACT|nr:ubiquinone/menaquinone biosynthesis methyltransferase [Solidesulfovibrio carbinoliphilus]EHJ47430.1 ubiquinone/menaquinone biosynthesis methyltransferase [Solidesulfovibrio carbinoliphilus subsp. oakridgensis]